MTKLTFAEAEYATKKRKARREVFLEKMDTLISWKQLDWRRSPASIITRDVPVGRHTRGGAAMKHIAPKRRSGFDGWTRRSIYPAMARPIEPEYTGTA